jgi:hypothetical protein
MSISSSNLLALTLVLASATPPRNETLANKDNKHDLRGVRKVMKILLSN